MIESHPAWMLVLVGTVGRYNSAIGQNARNPPSQMLTQLDDTAVCQIDRYNTIAARDSKCQSTIGQNIAVTKSVVGIGDGQVGGSSRGQCRVENISTIRRRC